MRLLNSGRGLEAWAADEAASARPKGETGDRVAAPSYQLANDHFILSRGPLSYSYKFFKIELHSAAPSVVGNSRSNEQSVDEGAAALELDSDPPEHLRIGKTSEHLIDGRSFDAEVQLHFYNRQLASSANEALRFANEKPIGSLFAVLSVFVLLQQGPQNSSISGPLDFLLDNLQALQSPGSSMELQLSRRQMSDLITDDREYVTYSGSLNRPPCSETVDWILLNKPLKVSDAKLMEYFEKVNTNQDNIRPVNRLNNRLLRTTIAVGKQARDQAGQESTCSKVSTMVMAAGAKSAAGHARSRRQFNPMKFPTINQLHNAYAMALPRRSPSRRFFELASADHRQRRQQRGGSWIGATKARAKLGESNAAIGHRAVGAKRGGARACCVILLCFSSNDRRFLSAGRVVRSHKRKQYCVAHSAPSLHLCSSCADLQLHRAFALGRRLQTNSSR